MVGNGRGWDRFLQLRLAATVKVEQTVSRSAIFAPKKVELACLGACASRTLTRICKLVANFLRAAHSSCMLLRKEACQWRGHSQP